MPDRDIRIVTIKESVLADNKREAALMADKLSVRGTFLLDIMGSPGAGKTTLLLHVLKQIAQKYSVGVIEADIESTLDAEKMLAAGIDAIQLHTGGACHIDIPMVEQVLTAIAKMPQVLVLENVGNLVCPAEFETGAHRRIALLSVPEGHDKVYKYPLMFKVVDAVVVTKLDTLPLFEDYDIDSLRRGIHDANPLAKVFALSCKTGEGTGALVDWLLEAIEDVVG
jgi:hydrogenase nickel incorporation protein HypB